MVRVAALQFASSTDLDANLETCLRMIDRAAREHAPELMVLPELSNHVPWYRDERDAAVAWATLEGPFLGVIAARAREHRAHIALGVSLLRDGGRATVTCVLFGPDGELLGQADRQTLVGHEGAYFARAEASGTVIDTPLGRIGLYSCSDGMTMETARCLALRGAQILCTSKSSPAFDEASLHVPARAADNHVFVVAANRVGPLLPEPLLESARAAHVPIGLLHGAGESQIVAPDGRVLGKAARVGEAIIVADIDLGEADHKLRPDGSHSFALRRPELYRPIGARPRPGASEPALDELEVAVVSTKDASSLEEALDAACETVRALANDGVSLIVLPELFCFEGGVVEDPGAASDRFVEIVRGLSEACRRTAAHVVTSLVERSDGAFFHTGLLLGQAGIVGRQAQLHVPARHGWARAGRRVEVLRMPWGRVALTVGEDLAVAETVKMCALAGAHVVAAPFAAQESWELALGARSRAAENRVCVAVATRAGAAGTSALYDLEREFTIASPLHARTFDGHLNEPLMKVAAPDQLVLRGSLHPAAANNKLMFEGTNLLDVRPWWLSSDLTERGLGAPDLPAESVEARGSAGEQNSDA